MERTWKGHLEEMKNERNRKEMERKRERNGRGIERKWKGNGHGLDIERNGKEMERGRLRNLFRTNFISSEPRTAKHKRALSMSFPLSFHLLFIPFYSNFLSISSISVQCPFNVLSISFPFVFLLYFLSSSFPFPFHLGFNVPGIQPRQAR